MEMDVSNLRVAQANTYTAANAASTKEETAETAGVVSTDAATFEADGGHSYVGGVRSGYTIDTETVEKLKSELEERMANLVQQMLGKQVTQSNVLEAIENGQFSQEDIEQAKKDTAEDGYWGVEQTSDRLVKFAVALIGGDPDKLDSMIEAFEKGYSEAEKQWGGELPELTQRTREATLKKFQDLKDQYAQNSSANAEASAQSVLESKVQAAAQQA
ncbi:MAG: hypothetical protein IKN81_03130 [Oscillospiraceae bacterium]|nr:hypothetical protein [Oscillospiraceae bacterium]